MAGSKDRRQTQVPRIPEDRERMCHTPATRVGDLTTPLRAGVSPLPHGGQPGGAMSVTSSNSFGQLPMAGLRGMAKPRSIHGRPRDGHSLRT
jgi:hypothetical protein